MNREQIIQMAREAGAERNSDFPDWSFDDDQLERFAALVADAEANRMHDEGMVTVGHMRERIAAEREECAKACEAYWQIDGTDTALAFAATVRAMGQA